MESAEPSIESIKKAESGYEKKISAIFFILAVMVAIWFRFDQLSLKPFHHDEGVNSHFLLNLADHGDYKYNPENYHGPTLYYISLLSLRIFGKTDMAMRFTPALFGVLAVLGVWLLRKHLGPIGTPVAAFLMALSPGLIYFSRDFIHEMLFGCFSLGIVVGAWRYAESKEFSWLGLTAISAGLLFATKETAIITALVLIIAAIGAAVWDITRRLADCGELTLAAFKREILQDLINIAPSLNHLLSAIIIFVYINIFFYSSIFSNWHGVTDAVKSVALWGGRSGSEHLKSFWYYCGVLLKLELPLLIGALLAGIFILWRGSRFWVFVGAWTFGLSLAYSIIGYKTPWLMISFLIPMALLSGYAAERIYKAAPQFALRLLLAVAIISVLIFNARLALAVNFDKYDDNGNSAGYLINAGRSLDLVPYKDGLYGYVYAQTDRDTLRLTQALKEEMDKFPSRADTPVYIASPEYWPLPWYFRDYKNVDYSGKLPQISDGAPQISQSIIIANRNQESNLGGMPGWRLLPSPFTLRPDVFLVIYVRDEMEQR